jgi:uncharacterized membrane protein YbaN (DUF454 family)
MLLKLNRMKNKIEQNYALRQVWFVLGLISSGLGIAGYILPVMPGTTFILIAAYCFAKSNEKWYNKLINNKYFGQTIKDFNAGLGMSVRAKITALVCVTLSIGISLFFASNMYVRIFLVVCAIVAVSCILWQKTKLVKV